MSTDIECKGVRGHVFHNWARTYSCHPERYFKPCNVEDLQKILVLAKEKNKVVRCAGNGHSPSDLVCTTDYLVSMENFNKVLEIDKENHTVTAQSGILLSQLTVELKAHGLALSVQGSVSEVTLAGAAATATHGTGINCGVLSSYILELEMLTADGRTMVLTRVNDGDTFLAACVSLGALGFILSLKIQVESYFKLQQVTYGLKFQDALESLAVHVRSSDHFRMYWYPHTDRCVLHHISKSNKAIRSKQSWFWDHLVGYSLLQFLYWLSAFLPRLLPYISRLYSKIASRKPEVVDLGERVFNFDCLFQQYVMEWSIPRDKTAVVLYELNNWIESTQFPAHFPVEVRFVKSDELLLSPCYGRETTYINLIMYRPYNKLVPHSEYWQAFQDIVMRAGGRPHWAKDHSLTEKELRTMFPKWDTFCQIRTKLDPEGRFLNSHLQKVFGKMKED